MAVIVLVEGSEFFRKALASLLKNEGHRCVAAASFAEAGPALRDPETAVLVFDLETCGPEGVEAFAELRARRPELRGIAVAGRGQQGLTLEALRAGAADYLAKPLHEEELRLSLARALEAHGTDRELAALRAAGAPAGAASGMTLARDLCDCVTGEGGADEVLAGLLKVLGTALTAHTATLYLRDPGSGGMTRAAGWEAGEGRDRERLRHEGLTAAAVEAGTPLAFERPGEDRRFEPAVDTAEGLPSGAEDAALWLAPLRFRGRGVGLVRTFLPPAGLPPAATAELLASTLSAALRSVLLYRSWRSGIDELARVRRESAGRRIALAPPRTPEP